MIFQNREEAAHLLAHKLKIYKGQNPLILGIPRGAMPMAQILAEQLEGELSAILVHKIPAPGYGELAVGAVGLSGQIFRLPTVEEFGISEEYLQAAAKEQIEILKIRKEEYHLPDLDCQGRVVIIVDDGIATGATVKGAILEIQFQKPKKLIVAAAAIAKATAAEIRPVVDDLVTLTDPDFFYAVSQFYVDFTQVTDREVIRILNASRKQPSLKGNGAEHEIRS